MNESIISRNMARISPKLDNDQFFKIREEVSLVTFERIPTVRKHTFHSLVLAHGRASDERKSTGCCPRGTPWSSVFLLQILITQKAFRSSKQNPAR